MVVGSIREAFESGWVAAGDGAERRVEVAVREGVARLAGCFRGAAFCGADALGCALFDGSFFGCWLFGGAFLADAFF